MGRVAERGLVVVLGFIAACYAAGLVMAGLGLALSGTDLNLGAAAKVIVLGFYFGAMVAALTVVPAAIVIGLGEYFGWRSPLFYGVAGLAIGEVAYGVTAAGSGVEGVSAAMIALAGLAGGLAYWVVAWRKIGQGVAQ